MPKNTAECGKRDERELVKDLTARGYSARRQPGSGNVDPTLPHDVVWEDSPIGRILIECKWRATCGWRTLIKWMEGAPILSVKAIGSVQDAKTGRMVSNPEGDRYVFMRWDTFMALVGDAAHRAEAADLGAQVAMPDKPYFSQRELDGAIVEHAAARELSREIQTIQETRDRIQAAHQNPPKRPMKPRRLGK